ncbi:hypothetical protein BGW38_006452 [Lunasporangiospora selenospora]|uniref:BTB domain-containing protein n=1 Tax=Lunasporangiospora selenospora TaxID=979761 RepID=A0A9P6G177_9FUNG|nr:hypothetical protein BGW38_006452 [Lunasporangiospora selenospora]
MEFSSFLPSFPPSRSNSRRVSAMTVSSPTVSSPILPPEPGPAPMPHLSASRVLFEEGLYSDVIVRLQVPGSTLKKSLSLHSKILVKESDLFSALLLGKTTPTDKAFVLLSDRDANGAQVIEIQCVDAQELYALESSLRLLYTGAWCSDRDFQTSTLDARLRRGMDVMAQAGRLALRGTTLALLQEEITQMCQSNPELMEKFSKSLRSEGKEDDQAILRFDRDALQQMCRIAVTKSEIRDHCELAIARNLYGAKKFRDLRMTEVQISELLPGYLFPPGGQESIYLLKGAPSLPLHPLRASNVDALRHVVDYYTAYNSQQPLRTREYCALGDDDEDDADDANDGNKPQGQTEDVTYYRVSFSSGYHWLMQQVIKVRAPFELIILLLKDAIDENADRRSNIEFGEFSDAQDGEIYLSGVSYIADGLLHAFQDPTLEAFRNPGASGSLLNMISYGVSSLTDLPPLRPKSQLKKETHNAASQREYSELPTLVMEFFWQILELALKRPHHLEFVQLLLDSITKIVPLAPFEVVDRIEERLAELLEETRKRIAEERGEVQVDEGEEDTDSDDKTDSDVPLDETQQAKPIVSSPNRTDEEIRRERTFSDSHRSEISVGRFEDFDDRQSMTSSVVLASEVSARAPIITTADDASSLHQDDDGPEAEAEADAEVPWMRPEYLQPLCLQLLTKFPMNIQSSLLWAIHDLQLM